MSDLDARLLKAHETGDTQTLVTLYTLAADAAQDDKARAFYLTHAHVFALEINHPDTAHLRAALIAMRCESPL